MAWTRPRSWNTRATTIAVFNPKGGVGKTTVATNLAAALQVRRGKNVLLIDADTVTGHVTTSLAIEAVRTVVDSWVDEAEGGPAENLATIASQHSSGMRVVSLTDSPLHTDILDPARFAKAIAAVRSMFDVIVIDLHPSYSPLNQAIFERIDRILVPVTPDVPAIRAAVQLREVAVGLGFRDRLAMVVNRANSGLSVEDMERTTGMPALALIRSGGLLFVRAANEGRTVIDSTPRRRSPATSTSLPMRPGCVADQARPGRARLPPAGSIPRSRSGSESRPGLDPDPAARLALSGSGRSSWSRPSSRPAISRAARPSGHRPARPAQVGPVDEDHVGVRRPDRRAGHRRRRRDHREEHVRARSSRRSGSEPGKTCTVPTTRKGGTSRTTS